MISRRSVTMGRLVVFTALLGAAFPSFPALSALGAEGALQVGTCKKEITPVSPGLAPAYQATFGVPGLVNHTDPVFMAGFGDNRRATGYNDRLWARGVVVQSQGERVAIVSLDLVGYFKNEIDTIRALVTEPVDLVVVTSTHQHEGPDTLGIWGPSPTATGIDFGYLDFVNSAVAACIDEAVAGLQKARIYYATTVTDGLSLGLDPEDDGFGVADGKVLVGDELLAPETAGRLVDPILTSIQFTTRSEPFDAIATITNFASHPESLGSGNTTITSDFPHYLRERIEAAYGGLAIHVSADLGVLQGPLDIDVLDPATGQPAPRRTFRWAEVHGTQVAERAISAIDAVRFVPLPGGGRVAVPSNGDPAPQISFSTVDPVPVRMDNPFFRFFIAIGVIDVRRSLFTDGAPDPSVGFPFPFPFDVLPQALGEDIHTEVSALRIGKGGIAVTPDELDPQIGNGYREALEEGNVQHTLIIGLGNDEIGYQLPAAKFDFSCFVCAPFILAGVPTLCPAFPPDCNTVFQNNVGPAVDPAISGAMQQAIGGL